MDLSTPNTPTSPDTANDMVSSDANTPTEAVDLMNFINAVVESTGNNISNIQSEKEALDDARSKGARLIVPWFIIPNNNPKNVVWPPGITNPTLKGLCSEILIRHPSAKCNYYDKSKYTSILLKIPCIPL